MIDHDELPPAALAAVDAARMLLAGLGAEIPVRIGVYRDYTALLGEHEATIATAGQLLGLACSSGRVLLSGRGGSGKTAMVRRLVITAQATGRIPLLVDLSTWNADATDGWQAAKSDPRDAIGFLLERFGSGAADATTLERLPVDGEKILFVDGLNESPGAVAEEILAACDQIAALVPGCSTIVADRLVRRGIRERVWTLASPLRLEQKEVDWLVGRETPRAASGFLDNPFFVDRAMKGELDATALQTIREYVLRHGSMGPGEIGTAALAAWTAYRIDRSRTFDMARFAEAGDEHLAERLREGGVLTVRPDGRVAFDHHWIHDYLAALHVANSPRLVDPDCRHSTLDVLSLDGNSFDAVGFAVELAEPQERAALLAAIYDWNPYAAGYALSGLDGRDADATFGNLADIVVAMLGEKLQDRLMPSRRKAFDALEVLHNDLARRIRETESLGQLIAAVERIEARSTEFERWKALFTIPPGSPAPQEAMDRISDPDAVLGWTAANVARRLELTDRQIDAVVELAKHEVPVVRWRACHLMGSRTSRRFRERLFERLSEDSDEWVRYGAVRSLVEMASRSPEAADAILGRLASLAGDGSIDGKELQELQRSLFLAPGCAPNGWALEGSRIFYALADAAPDAFEKERLFGLASRLRRATREPA